MGKKWSVKLVSLVFLGIFSIAGCYMPVTPPEITTQAQITPILPLAEYRIIGNSIQNRPIMCTILGQGNDTIFILATIHGDEPAGTPLVQKLSAYLQQNPYLLQGRKVILLPIANPDGMTNNHRYNAKGVDLNRNFASANWQKNALQGLSPLSEPETRAIFQLIQEFSPDRIVSIHQRLQNASACIDYDGPGQRLANQMAQKSELPIQKYGAQSGSLGSYAGLTLKIPIITIELPRDADNLDGNTLWQRYGSALVAAVVYPNKG